MEQKVSDNLRIIHHFLEKLFNTSVGVYIFLVALRFLGQHANPVLLVLFLHYEY